MSRKLVGEVTEEEKNEILVLYERMLGIEELEASLENDLLSAEQKVKMQDKMVTELDRVKNDIREWWGKMYRKYQWIGAEGHSWHIDFESCEIFLK